uniref:INSulin related n=1 Tax=Caenorhabditis japonica TaxID=281687 RepID=A0A8R1IMM5_CAEJA
MNSLLILLLLVVIAVTFATPTPTLVEQNDGTLFPRQELRRRVCGQKLLKFLSFVCPEGCITDVNIATLACSKSFTPDELVEMCCPGQELGVF